MSDSESIQLRGRAARLAPPEMQAAMARHAINDTANLPSNPAPAGWAEVPADTPRAEPPDRPKLGAEHFKSMVKLGFHEITPVLAAFPDSNIRPVEEPGVFGNEHMPHLRSHTHADTSPQEPDRTPCP